MTSVPAGRSVRLYGWTVRSAVEFRAAPAADDDGIDIEVEIDEPDEVESAPPVGVVVADHQRQWGSTLVRTEAGYVYRCPARYEVTISEDGRSVRARCDPRALDVPLAVMLPGSVLAMVLTLRGRSCIHATVVALDDSAVGIVGPSGRGKTTTAGLLLAAGAALVSEDVLAPLRDGGSYLAARGLLELRFRQSGLELAAGLDRQAERTTPDGRLGLVPQRIAPSDDTPLAAIMVPIPDRTGAPLSIERLSPTEAFGVLVASPRIEGWLVPHVQAQEFALAAELADSVPTFVARIPWAEPPGPELGRVLAAELLARVR